MIFLATLLLIINFALTYKIVKNAKLKSSQKNILLLLLWLVPFIGAIIVDILFDRLKT